jgi:hypothetical protein
MVRFNVFDTRPSRRTGDTPIGAGETVVKKGDPTGLLYFLIEGTVEVRKDGGAPLRQFTAWNGIRRAFYTPRQQSPRHGCRGRTVNFLHGVRSASVPGNIARGMFSRVRNVGDPT